MRIDAITIAVLKHDPKLAARLANRTGGIDVWADGRVVFRLWIPNTRLR